MLKKCKPFIHKAMKTQLKAKLTRWETAEIIKSALKFNTNVDPSIAKKKWYFKYAFLGYIVLSYQNFIAFFIVMYDWYQHTHSGRKPSWFRFSIFILAYQFEHIIFIWLRSTKFYKRFWCPFIYWPACNAIESFTDWFLRNASKLPGRTVYAQRFSRDCDMFERTWVVEYKNGFAYRYAARHIYDDCEGAESICRITKDDFKERDGHDITRDRTMEAYENGNGNSIWV
jgi:hypothetical protein